MERERQRTEPPSGHAVRPGSQALWISERSRCFDGSSSWWSLSVCILVDSRPGVASWAASRSLEVQAGSREADEKQPCPYQGSISSPPSSSRPRPPVPSSSPGLMNPRKVMSSNLVTCQEGSGLCWRGECEPPQGCVLWWEDWEGEE